MVAVGAAMALSVAGCGDDTPSAKEQYEDGFRAVIKSTEARGRGLGLVAAMKSGPRGAAVAYQRVRRFLLGMADRLDRLHPPAEVRAAHRTYVGGIREFATRIARRQFAVLARRGPKAALAVVEHPTADTLRVAGRMRLARDEFRKKGYDLGLKEELLP
jgi:hypothetical protein